MNGGQLFVQLLVRSSHRENHHRTSIGSGFDPE
jgi:hypothetical protein